MNGTLFASSHVTAIESIPHGCVKGCVIGISSASVVESANGGKTGRVLNVPFTFSKYWTSYTLHLRNMVEPDRQYTYHSWC